MIDKLLECGADVNSNSEFYQPALLYAIDYDDKDFVKKFLDKGADPNDQGEEGTMLTRAAISNDKNCIDIIKMLVEHGAKIDKTDCNSTPLMEAARTDCIENVKLFIKLGAKLDKKNKEDGNTALILAAGLGHIEVLSELINAGADLNIKNKYGDTALQIVNKIIKEGYYDKSDEDNMRVEFRDEVYDYDEVAKILRENGAK